jgi:hypothetical protein
MPMRKALLLATVGALSAGGAAAQEVYVEETYEEAGDFDDTPYVDHRAYVEPEAEAPGVAVAGPRVYGWSWEEARPDDCGTFKYWNGEYCADARYDGSDDDD